MSWLTNWEYERRTVTFKNISTYDWTGVGDNIYVGVINNISYRAGMKADFSDVRFTTLDGETMLALYRMDVEPSSSADFLVSIREDGLGKLMAGDSVMLYMYWGNAAASAVDESSLLSVPGLGDPFDDDSIDPIIWTNSDPAIFTEAGSRYVQSLNVGLLATESLDSNAVYGPGTELMYGFAPSKSYWTLDPIHPAANSRRTVIGFTNHPIPQSTGDCAVFQFPAGDAGNTFTRNAGIDGELKQTTAFPTDLAQYVDGEWGGGVHPYVFHNYRIRWMTAKVEFYIDDVLEDTHTVGIPDESNLKVRFLQYNWLYPRYWCDRVSYIIVRTIPAASEPDVMITFGEIETFGDPPLYNRVNRYLYDIRYEVNEERIRDLFPDGVLKQWIYKDIVETVLELGGILNQRYRHLATVAINSGAGGQHSSISHVANSTSVTGFSGLSVNAWKSILVVKDSVFYYAEISSNTATVVTLARGGDLPALSSDVVILTANNSNTYCDVSGLKKFNYAEPFWCVLDGSGEPIEQMSIEIQQNLANVEVYDGKVMWYQKGDEIHFALGSGATLSGHVYVGYYKLPIEDMDDLGFVDLPYGYHGISQKKTIARMLTKKGLHTEALLKQREADTAMAKVIKSGLQMKAQEEASR